MTKAQIKCFKAFHKARERIRRGNLNASWYKAADKMVELEVKYHDMTGRWLSPFIKLGVTK